MSKAIAITLTRKEWYELYLSVGHNLPQLIKMKYIIEITETLQRQIEVEAQNESEAIKLIKEKYKNEEIILSEQDFIDYEIDIIKQSIYIEICDIIIK